MKLQELAASKTTKQVSHMLESHFGTNVNFEKLTGKQAKRMLGRVRGLIREHRSSVSRHHNEKNPGYLKLVMMEQALQAKVKENMAAAAPATAQDTKQAADTTAAIQQQKDPKVKAALEKSARGQTLTPDEQKIVAGLALMKTEGTLRRALKVIKESEVQQAQVVLAAQDMVDKIQSMLEDTTEMQFKELPALVDSIRNQIGMDQAVQFQNDATGALSTLVQGLQGTKQSLEQALGVVTGQAQATPGLDAAMSGDAGGELPPVDGEEDVDLSLDANLDEPESDEAESPLGRGRR